MKPRLLIILGRFVIGGHASDTIPLAYRLRHDFDILILYGDKEPDEVEPWFMLQHYPGLQLKPIKRMKRSINPFNDFFTFFEIRQIIRQFKPAIVHTHGAKSGFLGRLAAATLHIPVVVHTFHGHLFHSYFNPLVTRLLIAVEKWLASKSTCLIALGQKQLAEIQVQLRLPASILKVIPLGIDYINPTLAQQNRIAFRQDYQLPEETIAVGIVGRLVPIKNFPFFVAVVASYLQQYQDKQVVFFIIGDGQEKASIEQQLMEKNIPFTHQKNAHTAKVFFTSWITDAQQAIDGLDVVVLTSFNEGTPFSLIEAQFCGKPVVAVNVGGVADTLQDNETGFLVAPGNVAAFAEKIHVLAVDEGLRHRMGKKGVEWVQARFSKEAEVKAFTELYLSSLQEQKLSSI
jgi:glycosyltransferase involved in cell wall biosynthesis